MSCTRYRCRPSGYGNTCRRGALPSSGPGSCSGPLASLRGQPEGDVIVLIQALLAKGKEFRQDFSDYGLADMVLALLAEALAASDEDTPVATLYDWLELMDFDEFGSARTRAAGYSAVSRWLAKRPNLQKQLALEGLGRQLRRDDPEVRGDESRSRCWNGAAPGMTARPTRVSRLRMFERLRNECQHCGRKSN